MTLLKQDLNPAQREAVIALTKGHVVVIAGAGTGKTKTLTHTLAYLVTVKNVDPHSILLLTFTNRAAGEMIKRAENLIGNYQTRITGGTFHAYCARVLRKHGKMIGFKPNFTILDSGDASSIISGIRKDRVPPRVSAGEFPTSPTLAKIHSDSVNRSKTVEEIVFKKHPTFKDKVDWIELCLDSYRKYKRQHNLVDFDDLLILTLHLLRKHPVVQAQINEQFQYVLVDECLEGSSPILMADGLTKDIKTIVDKKLKGNVLSYDAKAREMIPKPIIGWHRVAVSKPMVRVTLRQVGFRLKGERLGPLTEYVRFGHRFLICTTDHKVLLSDHNWCSADALIPGKLVVLESSAPKVASYKHRAKHGPKGLRRLSHQMARKNASGVCGQRKEGSPDSLRRNRGGNGKGPTETERAVLEKLGEGWISGHVVVPQDGLLPYHYKIDVSCPGQKLAIELDGQSHCGRESADDKKDDRLARCGWQVVRILNKRAWSMSRCDFLSLFGLGNCPVLAEVVSVDIWTPRNAWVYDITVKDTHTYLADGIVVHNCQDTNLPQMKLIRHFVGPSAHLMTVADDAQAIYGWRGARHRNVFDLAERYSAQVVKLEQNYRSVQPILDVVNCVQGQMKKQFQKTLFTKREGGTLPQMIEFGDIADEAETVCDHILQLQKQGEQLSDIAVLYRTNMSPKHLEAVLSSKKVPYNKWGGIKFLESARVKDILAYLRCASNPKDDLAAKRLLVLCRGVGMAKAGQVLLAKPWAPLDERIEMFIGPNDDKWKDLHSLGQALYAIDPKGSPKIQVENVVRHYAELISGRDVDQELEEVEGDLKILREIASRYKSINRMLQDLTLDPPEKGVKKDREDRLTLSTIHSGKGLEWKHVFLIQANDIPYLRFGSKNVDFDEERRILYVALTRAKDNLVITWIQGEKCHLSQFLAALPPKLLTWDKTHSRNPWSRGW